MRNKRSVKMFMRSFLKLVQVIWNFEGSEVRFKELEVS